MSTVARVGILGSTGWRRQQSLWWSQASAARLAGALVGLFAVPGRGAHLGVQAVYCEARSRWGHHQRREASTQHPINDKSPLSRSGQVARWWTLSRPFYLPSTSWCDHNAQPLLLPLSTPPLAIDCLAAPRTRWLEQGMQRKILRILGYIFDAWHNMGISDEACPR